MVLTLPLAIGDFIEPMSGKRRLLTDIYLAGLPLWIAFAIVLLSSVIVGLPVHYILEKRRIASHTTYVVAGVLAGFLVPLLILLAIGAVAGFWMATLGAFSGGVTAHFWSGSLEALCPKLPRYAAENASSP